jgi:hypothetical protein
MTKTVSFTIMILAFLMLIVAPIYGGDKNGRSGSVTRNNDYWQFRSDPDASKSGWSKNPNWGQNYHTDNYHDYDGGHNQGNKEGKGKNRRGN